MKRKKPKFIPATLGCEPTLDLKPIPAAVSAESAGKPGEGAIRRITKAVRTTRPKKAKRKGA
jgi:hypothetical protein